MQMLDVLRELGATQAIARELGVSEATVDAGASALLPAIVGGFKKQANTSQGGLDELVGALGELGGGGLLDEVLGHQSTNVARGNDVLGQIFGSREVSRTVAQHAAGRTHLDVGVLKQMLPMLAMLVGGYLARQQSGGAPDVPVDRGPGVARGAAPVEAGPSARGAGGLAAMLDLNGNGNPLDDLLEAAARFVR